MIKPEYQNICGINPDIPVYIPNMGVMDVNRARFYLAAGLYLAVTLLKLTVPAFAAELKESILPVMREDVDYVAAVSDLGALLTDNEMVQAVMQPFSEAEPVQETAAEAVEAEAPVDLTDLLSPSWPGNRDPAELAARAEELRAEWEAEEAEAREAAVVSFLASQEAYAALALPENVTYEAASIPYDYVTPVFGSTASGFGYRMHPIAGEVRFHYGTDFAVKEGTEIAAFTAGTVCTVGNEPEGYGLYVILDHGRGWKTLYAHCSRILVTEGQRVSMGETLALVGQTGAVTGAHLHFELISDGVYLNPEYYIQTL